MKVTCLISASPSPSSYIANTLLSSQQGSASSSSPHSLVLDPAVLASLSPFLAPLLSSSTCLLIPEASSTSLKLASTLLTSGSCKGPCHLLQEVQVSFRFLHNSTLQEVLVALGCQETVQTLLGREILTTTEVAIANPDCDVRFSEVQGTAANCVTSVGNNDWREGSKKSYSGRKGETAGQEKLEEHQEEEKWQQQGATIEESDIWADQRESGCEENDSEKNSPNKGERGNIDANQENLAVEKSKLRAKKRTKVTLLSCKLCSYEVKFSGGTNRAAGHLRTHMKSAHGVEQPKFSCDKCPYNSAQAGHLKRHQNAKHEGIRHQCNLCEKSFSIKDALTRHVESKHKGKTFPCPQCEYETPRMTVLRNHIRIRHLKLSYECDLCGHKVNSKANLKIHNKIVHEGLWLHCSEEGCDYKAKDSSTFRHHKKVVHDGERLDCPHCSLRFTKITSLKSHMKKKHNANAAEI